MFGQCLLVRKIKHRLYSSPDQLGLVPWMSYKRCGQHLSDITGVIRKETWADTHDLMTCQLACVTNS